MSDVLAQIRARPKSRHPLAPKTLDSGASGLEGSGVLRPPYGATCRGVDPLPNKFPIRV